MNPYADRIALHTWTLDTTPLHDVLRIARHVGYAAIELRYIDCSGASGRGFAQVPAREILAFQLSDAPPGPPSKVWTALDRLPPGKGAVEWNELFGLLMEKGYAGFLSYEAPNPAQWSRELEEVAREGLRATRELLDAASARSASRV